MAAYTVRPMSELEATLIPGTESLQALCILFFRPIGNRLRCHIRR